MHIFKDTNFDFLKWRWHAIALSWIIIIAGAVVFLTKGIPLGIEFAGGTAVIVKFEQPTSVQQVRAALDKSFPGGAENVIVQSFGDPGLRQVMIRVPHVGAATVRSRANSSGSRSGASHAARQCISPGRCREDSRATDGRG